TAHQPELAPADQTPRSVQQRRMDRNHVGGAEQLVELDALRPPVSRLVRVGEDDPHVETLEPPGHKLADSSLTDEPDRCARPVPRHVRSAPRPPTTPYGRVV